MNNTYKVPKESIFDIYDDIAKFTKRFKLFQQEKPEYLYEFIVTKIDDEEETEKKWELCTKIWKDEQFNEKILKEAVNPFGVL